MYKGALLRGVALFSLLRKNCYERSCIENSFLTWLAIAIKSTCCALLTVLEADNGSVLGNSCSYFQADKRFRNLKSINILRIAKRVSVELCLIKIYHYLLLKLLIILLQITYALKFKWLKTVILITPEEQLKIISRFPLPILSLE